MTDSELLTDITKKIVEHFHPRRIVLFGSARAAMPGPKTTWTCSLKWRPWRARPSVR